MKKIFFFLLLMGSLSVCAQPKLITQAVISTKTTIVAPETDEVPTVPAYNENGEQMRIVRFGGEGETKTTTWLKNNLVKTYSENEMGRTTAIRDNSKKITTTIMEMMGKKSGFYATDEDQEYMRKRIDSMMKSRGPNANPGFGAPNSPATFSIIYINEDKKISGYQCKKALTIATRSNGKSDTTTIWYCPDFKLQNLPSTGGTSGGFGGFNAVTVETGMENLNGFPLQYERMMNRGRHMTVEVTKLVLDKDIADKEFEIPKDIEVKPMKDMQNGGGPGFQIRIGG
jgi:GLPGLI family protein